MTGVQTCARSEEHTSELQSHDNLVCRLLLEKKKQTPQGVIITVLVAPPPRRGALQPFPHPGGRPAARPPLAARAGPIPRRRRLFFFNDRAPPNFSPFPLPPLLPT